MLFIPSSFKWFTYIIYSLSPRPYFSNSAGMNSGALHTLVKGTTTCYPGNYTRSPKLYCIRHSNQSDFQNSEWDMELENSDCGDGEDPFCHSRSPGNIIAADRREEMRC